MSKRVLIVDDISFARLMIKRILTSEGYEVVGEAGDGISALVMYEKLKPDVVTMDLTMPEFSGIKGLKAIIAVYPKAKIVIVSSVNQESFVKEVLQSGAKGYVAKPFSKSQLLKAIEDALAKP